MTYPISIEGTSKFWQEVVCQKQQSLPIIRQTLPIEVMPKLQPVEIYHPRRAGRPRIAVTTDIAPKRMGVAKQAEVAGCSVRTIMRRRKEVFA